MTASDECSGLTCPLPGEGNASQNESSLRQRKTPKIEVSDTATTDEASSIPEHSGDSEFDDTVPPPMDTITTQDTELKVMPDTPLTDFLWTTSPQPHAVRRREILKKYPEIEELYGNDPSQALTAIVTIVVQLAICYYISLVEIPTWTFLLMTFVVSGTLNHSLFAAMHEGSHRTIFEGKRSSELFCIATTIPMGLPAAMYVLMTTRLTAYPLLSLWCVSSVVFSPFKRYHLDHHIYQGVTDMDPDIPTVAEGWFFRSTWKKFLWILFLPGTYSLRPMITRPKEVVVMDVFNWILNFVVDTSIAYFWGLKSLLYFLLGTFFSMNFHPMAGHFISEHFIFPGTDAYQETSSYYGLWNLLTYNVGYHNEHHDFPRVPGSRLPLVREMAPEFYDIPYHKGWMRVMWKFLLTPSMTPFNRVKRVGIRGGALPKTAEANKLHAGTLPYGGDHYFWPKML